MLKGKKIILCVTGSIATYKSAFLLRLLMKEGADVRVIMTEHAAEFVSPLTFSTLSGQRVMVSLFKDDHWENHAILGRWADLVLIAPATAQTIAKMANGFCDNLLLAVYLSATCPVMVAPAMDEDMWLHPSVKRNLDKLVENGVHVIAVVEGALASGLSGLGRLEEPDTILKRVVALLGTQGLMAGKKVLITSGPTQEPIDPVRYISNHSSGKMGVSLANAFANAGAAVTVVTGPTQEHIVTGITIKHVITAEEMYNASMPEVEDADILIMAAAVADFTPVTMSDEKIKKSDDGLQIRLKPTKDILAEAGKRKRPDQLLIGFALETQNEEKNAMDKLIRKNADFIVLNSLRDKGAGFGVDTNKVSIFGTNGIEKTFPLQRKEELAENIVGFVNNYLKNKKS